MRRLDIDKLVKTAGEIINDPQLEIVEQLDFPVQFVTDNRGRKFELRLVLKSVEVVGSIATKGLPEHCVLGWQENHCEQIGECQECFKEKTTLKPYKND